MKMYIKLNNHFIPFGQMLILFFLVLSTSSCELFKNIGNRNNNNNLELITTNKDSTKKDTSKIVNIIPPSTKIDTIVWVDTLQETQFKKLVIQYTKIGKNTILTDTLHIIDISNSIENPEGLAQERLVRVKPSYNVAVIMPFMTKLYNFRSDVPAQSLRSVEFYEGMKLAFDSLEKEGVRLNITVYDSQRDVEEVQAVLKKPELLEADLIFGPVGTEALREVAKFGLAHGIPVISAFNNNPEVAEDNHYFIQVNPSFATQSRYIAEFLTKHIKMPPPYSGIKKVNYLMLGMVDDTSRMKEVQNAYSLAKNDPSAKIPQKVLDAGNFTIDNLKSHFSRDAINVVIVPSYRSEPFVTAVLRELSAMVDLVEKKYNHEFLVIGMPQWKYYERVNFEYYENLKLHITDEFFVNTDKSENIKFRDAYRANYGIAPREFAYIGFDLTLYFGRLLKKYGTAFPDKFEEESALGRHTKFYFEPMMRIRNVLDGGNLIKDTEIMRFENQYINFLEFNEYQFKPIDMGVLKEGVKE